MKTAAVSVTSEFAVPESYPALNRIRNTSAFFRKLSLNAEKNWHQNSGAKRRDVIRESDIGDSSRKPRYSASLTAELGFSLLGPSSGGPRRRVSGGGRLEGWPQAPSLLPS